MSIIFNPLWSLVFRKRNEPSLWEKIDIALTDAEVEGATRGIAKASWIYESILEKLKQDCAKLEALAIEGKEQEKLVLECIDWLKSLEQERDALKRKREEKIEQAAKKFKVSGQTIASTLSGGGTAFDISDPTGGLLDLIYDHKMRKIAEYEEKYYKETVEKIWKPKVKELTDKIQQLKDKLDEDLKERMALFEDTISGIFETMRQIAELKIILGEE